jgi:hypothetical protein
MRRAVVKIDLKLGRFAGCYQLPVRGKMRDHSVIHDQEIRAFAPRGQSGWMAFEDPNRVTDVSHAVGIRGEKISSFLEMQVRNRDAKPPRRLR